jgi:hypothetical protein
VAVLFGTILIAVFTVLGVAKLAAVPPMRQAAEHLGLSVVQYRAIGALELAGSAGVALGLITAPIGIAAAIGLGLLMLGAAGAHAAHRDGIGRMAVPLVTAGVAVAYVFAVV